MLKAGKTGRLNFDSVSEFADLHPIFQIPAEGFGRKRQQFLAWWWQVLLGAAISNYA